MIDCEGRKVKEIVMTLYRGDKPIKRLVPQCKVSEPGKLLLTGQAHGTFEFDSVGVEIWGKLTIRSLGSTHWVSKGTATIYQEVEFSFT